MKSFRLHCWPATSILLTVGLALALTGLASADQLPSQQAYLKAPQPGQEKAFGTALAIDGNTLVVGSHEDTATELQRPTGPGEAFVYVRERGRWRAQTSLTDDSLEPDDQFGAAVAISGDTIVVGAHYDDSAGSGDAADNSLRNSGAAYVFVRDGDDWVQQAYLKASNPGTHDTFGGAVAICGDTIVIGADSEDSDADGLNQDGSDDYASGAGAVYIFIRQGSTWTQQAYLKTDFSGAGDRFGWSLALSDDTLIVGAPGEKSGARGVNGDQTDDSEVGTGAAYVFVREGETWTQQAYLKASNSGRGDSFGGEVAISGDTVVVGARNEKGDGSTPEDDSLIRPGAAYVFVREGGTWHEQAYLKAARPDSKDVFGDSVAIEGDTILVGAKGEDSSATGINGDQLNEDATYSGSVYLFTRSDSTWTQQAYLKASNTAALDSFGWAVDLSEGTIAIAAPGEDSSSPALNGNEGDNSLSASGAVFVFGSADVFPSIPLSSVRRRPEGVHLTVRAMPSQIVGVEYSPDLSPGSWIDAGNFLQIDGQGHFLDADPDRLARKNGFYRAFLRPAE